MCGEEVGQEDTKRDGAREKEAQEAFPKRSIHTSRKEARKKKLEEELFVWS